MSPIVLQSIIESQQALVAAMRPQVFAQFEDVPSEYLVGAGALIGLFVFVLLLRFFRRRRGAAVEPTVDLSIDVSELGDQGPPSANIALELYNLPVRLAAVVIAPTGRGSQLPLNADAAAILDNVVPGLAEIVHAHKPLIRRWPAQLSTQGFSNTLFANVRLPGEHGKGTPWSIVAGRFEADGQNMLAGLVLIAARPNSLGQFVVNRPGQWLDLLRVRRQ
jgi:hypothetical protein